MPFDAYNRTTKGQFGKGNQLSKGRGGRTHKMYLLRQELYPLLDEQVTAGEDEEGKKIFAKRAKLMMVRLVNMALEGDMKALMEVCKIGGFYAPVQSEITGDINTGTRGVLRTMNTEQLLAVRAMFTKALEDSGDVIDAESEVVDTKTNESANG